MCTKLAGTTGLEQNRGRCKYDLCVSAPWLIKVYFIKKLKKKSVVDPLWPQPGCSAPGVGSQHIPALVSQVPGTPSSDTATPGGDTVTAGVGYVVRWRAPEMVQIHGTACKGNHIFSLSLPQNACHRASAVWAAFPFANLAQACQSRSSRAGDCWRGSLLASCQNRYRWGI